MSVHGLRIGYSISALENIHTKVGAKWYYSCCCIRCGAKEVIMLAAKILFFFVLLLIVLYCVDRWS